MNNKHLHSKQRLSKMRHVVVLMLLALFWTGVSFAQVNLVTWNFAGTASTDFTASAANRNGVRSTSLASVGSGYTLYDIVNSNNTTLTYKAASNNYFALQAYNTAFANNTTDYIQTSVSLPTGYVFGSNPLSLVIQSGGSSATNKKYYKVYYQYSTSTSGIPTSAVTTSTGSTVGSGIANGTGSASTTAYDEVDEVPAWVSPTTTSVSVANTNTVTIPAPSNSSSTVLTIQVRLWGSNASGNWRIGLFQLTAPNGDIVSPVPTISSLSPASSTLFAGSAAQTLTIVGTNFDNTTPTTVTFNGNSKTVTYTSSTQISIPLTTTDLQTAGTYPIVVANGSNTVSANYTVLSAPTVTIADNGTQPSAGNILQASTKNNLQSLVINNTTSSLATLNTLKAHFTGTYTASDINSFKVYYNSSNSLASAVQVASSVSASTNASQSTTGSETINFTLNKILIQGNNYFWVVVNPDASANITSPFSTVRATALSSSDFGFTTTTISSASVSAGGIQTIAQGQTVYMDDITNQPSGNIAQNAKVALAGFYLNPYASSLFSGVNVYATGSATATDITAIAIYKDVNNNGVYDAGTDVLVSTNTPTFSTSNSVPMAFALNQTISSKTQYLIVATIGDVFVSTIGHTVQVSINDQDFTVSNYPAAGASNGGNSLSIVAPTGTSTLATNGTPAATISSLVTTSGAAVPVYSFDFHNDNTNTNAASLISQIVIGQGGANSALFVNWTNIIGGATLSDGTNTVTGTVGTSGITFSSIPTTSDALGYVATNTTKTYTLSIYLKSSLSTAIQQGINGAQLAFTLTNSSFTLTGSTLAASQSINSGTTNGTISVIATQLAYVQAPTSGSPNVILTPAVTVQAVDANGNYATSYAGTVTLASTPSGISGTLSASTSNGLATFSTLQFSATGTYSITATSGSLTAVSANALIANALYTGNAAGTAYTWETSNVWGTTSSNTASTSWTEGDDAFFITKGSTITVGSNHTATSLNFNATGFNLTGTGTLTLSGTNPGVNIVGSGTATFNLPISAASNLLFAPTTGTATMTIGANGAAANKFSANLPNGATLGLGLNTVNLLCSYPFGNTNSPLYVNSSIASPSMITTSSATAVTTPMPLTVSNNIVISTGGALSLCPTGAGLYGNLIKYTGVISGAANAICMSNSLGTSTQFATGGKGMVYFGAKNTYSGTTFMAGNQGSLICGGGDNTLPSTTDVLFFTGATAGDAPLLDLNGSNEKVASISGTDGLASHVTTGLYPGGVYNSLTYTQNYAATTTSVTVFDSLISSYISAGTIAVGTKVFGSGITYGTTISSITKQTIAGYTCDVLGMSQAITSVLSANQGFYIFFENPTQKTLTIEGVGSVGGPYDPQVGHTIDRTNANYGATINGNVALTLSANNASANKLTLLNTNTYIGNTTVTNGTLVFAHVGGNTIPTINSVTVNGGVLEISTSQTLANLTISSGTLLVDAGATLTITGTFTNTGGTVTNNGTISYSGSAAFTTGGTTINNNGTLSVTAANLVVATGILTNAVSSTISVTNNTINVTGGTLTNNGILATTSNVSVTGGIFNSNTNQTVNNLSVTSNAATVNIANNTTTTINGTLTYAGNIANSGTIAYGASGGLTYGFTHAKFQFNNAYEFVAPNLPATLTLPVGDTILLDNDYVFPGNLVLNGVITSLGTFLSPNTLTLTGTSKTITGNGTIGSIAIAGTVTVSSGSSLNVLNKLVLSSGTFTTNNNVTLKSTSIDSSAIVDVVASGVVNGNITVERYIPKGYRAYRDMASQVYAAGSIFSNWQENGATPSSKGIFITGASAADLTSSHFSGTATSTNPAPNANGLDYSINGNASAFQYVNGSWNTGITNTKTTNLDPFQGYRVLVRGARDFNLYKTPLIINLGSLPMVDATTLRATGQLVTGTVTYSISGVTGTANGAAITSSVGLNSSATGFSLVPNPYVAPVQWSTVYAASSHINASYWYLDPTSSSTGKYIAYNAITGTAVSGYTSTASVVSTGKIQAGQAILVQNTTSSPSVVFTEAAKATSVAKAKVFGITAQLSKIYVGLKKLQNNAYASVDYAAIAFSNHFNNTTYGTQDALKFGSTTDNLSISDKNKALSIDGRLPATAADVLPISLAKLNNASYQLVVDATNYNGLSPVLKDNFKGTTTDLAIGINTIDFVPDSLIAASFANRFSLGFKPTTLAVNSIVASASLSNKVATISWNTVGEKNVARFEVEKSTDAVSFTKIAQATAKNTTSASYTTTDNSVNATTYYRIKAISEVGTVTYSNIAKLQLSVNSKQFTVYPNPLVGKILNVSFGNSSAGKYTVTITNVLGQKVQEAAINHAGGIASHAITVNSALAAGTYTVSITQVGSNQVVSQTKLSVN